jgi:phosphopantetheinyl transferase
MYHGSVAVRSQKLAIDFLLEDRAVNVAVVVSSIYEEDSVAEQINFDEKVCDDLVPCNDLVLCLADPEISKYHSFGSSKRKVQFVLGRVAAKKAISFVIDKSNVNGAKKSAMDSVVVENIAEMTHIRDIAIVNEFSGNPVAVDNRDCGVSISHAGNCAAAIAFENGFSFGLDLEYINSEKERAMRKLAVELALENDGNDLPTLTLLWSLKEALGKAELAGLRLPSENLRVKTIGGQQNCGIEMFECEYANADKYSGFAIRRGNSFLAIAHEKQLTTSCSRLTFFQ